MAIWGHWMAQVEDEVDALRAQAQAYSAKLQAKRARVRRQPEPGQPAGQPGHTTQCWHWRQFVMEWPEC
jgi:hypothetical protein|eukprot:COSAG01_NODE_4524_length_4947_cov_56.073136_4_plen_69_part_00